jgi:propionyl-CoA synthetase
MIISSGYNIAGPEVEATLIAHPDVAECAVIGIKDALKGQVPVGFVVVKAGVSRSPKDIEQECIALVRDRIGAVASFKRALVVPRLPKTRSGKILRGTMRKIADGEPWQMPATIDDPAILEEIAGALAGHEAARA